MYLTKLRFILGVSALLSVVAMAVLVLFYGAALTSLQSALLGILIAALIAECKASSAYVFDGTPDAPDAPDSPAPATTPANPPA